SSCGHVRQEVVTVRDRLEKKEQDPGFSREIKLPKYFLSCSLVHLSEILRPLGAMQMQSQSLGDKY
uniref:Uncharacterized protein n=2 Tax=Brassica oleracea TaxID=3712 RepID=A0A0D2ZTR4_BRAOL